MVSCTRDAAVAWVVQVSVRSHNQDVRWLLFYNSDSSQPRHEFVDADAVVTTSTACFNFDATGTTTVTAKG